MIVSICDWQLRCTQWSLQVSEAVSCVVIICRAECAGRCYWNGRCPSLSITHPMSRDSFRILVWEGHWQRVCGIEVPQRGPGAQPQWWSGSKAPEARRMLRHEAKTPLTERKNKSIQTDIVWKYHNYHHLIDSSFYVSSHFCLKIQNAVCGLQSQRNGPQWQPGLIKRVSWKEHYCNIRKLVSTRRYTLCFKKQFTLLLFAITKSDVDRFQ